MRSAPSLACQTWAPLPLQVQSWTGVPLPVPPLVTSMHRPLTRSVPSGSGVQLWAAVPLQSQIWTWAPGVVLSFESSTHLPATPAAIGPLGGGVVKIE